MRRFAPVLFAGAVLLATALAPPVVTAAAPDAPRASASRDGWPDTRPGRAARGWVEAFSKGDSAMRAYLTSELAPSSLEKRSIGERMDNYHKRREQYGKLVLASIVSESAERLTARLMSSDASLHEFEFTIQKEAPYKLVSVAIKEGMHGAFGGFHH
jgi:hypothetical protein